MPTYVETVTAYPWVMVFLRVAVVGSLVTSGVILADGDASLAARLTGGLVAGAVGLLLLIGSIVFTRLNITVTSDELRFYFGPFGRTIRASDIAQVAVETYPWLAFTGWGIRIATGRRRAAEAFHRVPQ